MPTRDDSQYPKVAVIVLNWNDKRNSEECLTSLQQLDYTNIQTVIVDNASTDGSQIFLRERFPEITIVENRSNLGFSGGFNQGIETSLKDGADYILCLNNDTVVDRQMIKELVREGEKRKDVGALCPLEYDYSHPSMIVYAGGKYGFISGKNRGFGETDVGKYERIEETGMLCGAAIMLKAEAIRRVGLFDAEYFFNWEDRDMATRLIKTGYKLLFVPKAKLWHKRMESTQGTITPLRVYFSLRNGVLFARKHYGPFRSVLFTPTYVLIYSMYAIAKSTKHRATIGSLTMALLWHIDRALMPTDEAMVEILRRAT